MVGSVPVDSRPCSSSYRRSDILAKAPGCVTTLWEPARLPVARRWPAYRSLLDYAVLTFTPKDILRFLGRKWDRRFDGEVHTHYENDRWFGTRIKHRMKTNWLKVYDKFGLILRVETVINCPKEFS